MSDPRDVAHDKRVAQEKKHEGADAAPDDGPVAQPGKKAAKNKRPAVAAGEGDDTSAAKNPAVANASAAAESAALAGSLIVLAQLKDLEFHSRAHLERLAALTMTIEDELQQKEIAGPLGEVYSAQNALQTKLTALIELYNAE